MLNTRTSAHQSSTIKNKTMSSDDKRLKIHTLTGKYILLLVLLCSATVGLFAQDVITKTDGTEIQATVTQIGVNEIKYIRYGTTAPVYTLLKSDIFMIKYDKAICYSGFRQGQAPGIKYPDYEEVKEDLLILHNNWKYFG